ncbi:hypothetical protein GQ600_848 [Phytophthora cactorum]|nr:hypothetical protein GQ600_848 [Phytophthora cactorum]
MLEQAKLCEYQDKLLAHDAKAKGLRVDGGLASDGVIQKAEVAHTSRQVDRQRPATSHTAVTEQSPPRVRVDTQQSLRELSDLAGRYLKVPCNPRLKDQVLHNPKIACLFQPIIDPQSSAHP